MSTPTYRPSDDTDLMERAAREALTMPDSAYFWDERLFNTHGAVMSWADSGDDILAESNYHAMLDALNGAVAHDETGASEARDDDVLDLSASHWMFGSLRTIYVRVFDEAGNYTPAFREAVDISTALQDYPIIDESDYSEREWEANQVALTDAIDSAERDHPDDSDADRMAITWLMDREEMYPESCSPDDLDYDAVSEAYVTARNIHFDWLATWYQRQVECNGQLTLV